MRFINFLWLFIFVLAGFLAEGQQLLFKTYTASDGLVANPITCIYQDKRGFMWIGTHEGLSRYDGYKFTNYTTSNGLQNNFINNINEIDGKILVAENGGSIDFIENSRLVKRYRINSAANRISNAYGKWLVSTDANGFYEYLNNGIINPVQDSTIYTLGSCIPYGDSLILCDGIDNKLLVYTKSLRISAIHKFPKVHFYNFYTDSKKRIFACTTSGLKLLKTDVDQNESISFSPMPANLDIPALNSGQVTCMQEMKDGSYWVGTTNGLLHIDANGLYKTYGKTDGLPSYIIKTLFKDKEENLWIGTERGLAKWVSNNHISYHYGITKPNQKFFWIYPMPGKKLILSTGQDIFRYDLDNNHFKKIPVTEPYIPIHGTYPLQLFFKNHIQVLNENDLTTSPIQSIDSSILFLSKISKHASGSIFFAGFDGLYSARENRVKKLLPYRITALETDHKGVIWAGTWANGLFKLNIIDIEKDNYYVENISTWIDDTRIRSLCLDSQNRLWVGTRHKGVFALTIGPENSLKKQQFSRHNGLMSEWVKSINPLPGGDMWIGTNLGLDRLVMAGEEYSVFNFSRKTDFYAPIEQVSYLGNNDWLCLTDDGFTKFTDEKIHTNLPGDAVILSAIMGIKENKKFLVLPAENIKLSHKQNAARFEFSALNFTNEKQIYYSYRLAGSSNESWSIPENIHEASYANLAPGSYSFEVRTVNWDMQPGKTASFSFVIKSPFYKQWWFILLVSLCIAAIVYSIYRYRLQQILKLQQIRNTIATDLHDDIGSALTNISILAELTRQKTKSQEFTDNLPVRISEEAMLAQQALDDIIWSVNTNNDNLNQTMARMRRYAAETFEPVGINCHIKFPDLDEAIKINMEQRKDIYLVFKECMHNIVKHANAKNVYIKIELNKHIFKLSIKDDGKGFDPIQQTHRNGLKNMRARIQRWNGELQVYSLPLKGSEINCQVPLASPE